MRADSEPPVLGAVSDKIELAPLSQSRAAIRTRRSAALAREGLLETLIADVQDYAIFVLDVAGNVASWNAGATRFKGYEADEIIGRHFSIFYPPQDIADGKPQRELAIAASDGRLEDEGWRVRRDGTRLWANVVITALRDPAGLLIGYGKVTRDLTDRRAQELRILDREQLVSGVLAAATECSIIGSDLNGVITIFNTGAERMLGYRSSEIVGEQTLSFMHDPGQIAQRAQELQVPPGFEVLTGPARHGEAETGQWTYVRRDGSCLAVQLTVTAVLDGDGEPKGFIGIAVDLSERRRAEAALRTAEQRFRRAFDDAPMGMAIVAATPNALGQLMDVNHAMCALTGYDRTALLQMTLGSLSGPADVGTDAETIGQMLSGAIDRSVIETRYTTANGDTIDVSVGLSLIRDVDDHPLHVVALVDDVSSRKRYENHLRHMADHDPLTALPNRVRMDRALDAQVARGRRYAAAGALLMIDVDHFKQINDRVGHSGGDRILVGIARTLQGRVRDTDVLARLGGDEFAVLMSEGGAAEAQALASDLSDLVRRRVIVPGGGSPGGVTISIGIALFDDREDLVSTDVMRDADAALYTAKDDGRNRIAAYATESGRRQRHAARLTMHNQIAGALKDDRFELLLQPVMDLRTGAISKYEALLRMIATDGSAIVPAAFLYVAERFDQINAIDRWVIEHAIALLADIPEGRSLEINLSGRSLGDPDLAAHIGTIITSSGADPARLIFEITETAAIENIHRAQEFVNELTALGCRFALDDFGAGFGSFYYLKHLSSDYIKIDGEFVRNCARNRTDQIVIQALVQLARGLDKETIAECVEDAEILTLVRALGVDYAQGYEIARPQRTSQLLGAAH